MNRTIHFIRIALALGVVVASTAVAATAGALPPPRVELTGTGTFQSDPWITAVRSEVSGRPFDGRFTGGLRIDTMPAPGTCVDTAMLFGVTRDDGRQDLGFIAMGELCGHDVQDGVSVVTAVFTGGFDLYEGSRPDLVDTQGFVEVRFAADGRAAVTVVDS